MPQPLARVGEPLKKLQPGGKKLLTYLSYNDIIDIMKQFIVRNIPDELHKAFKIHCAKQEVTINDEIIYLITRELERRAKLEEKA